MSQSRIRDLLQRQIEDLAPEEGVHWLTEKRDEIAAGAPSRVFYTSFSAVPRYLDKTDLELSASEQETADEVRTGQQPASWSVDQAGRILLALSLPHDDPDDYRAELDRVCEHADVGESVALCLALPLLPHPEQHRERAAEGVRSNMTAVLAAVALRNVYPAEQFDDPAWNQMVLKAAFEGLPFRTIYGLDERANPTLSRMLVDNAHERWAADRPVSPELWRPVGPFGEGEAVDAEERPERPLPSGRASRRGAAVLEGLLLLLGIGAASRVTVASGLLAAGIAGGAVAYDAWAKDHVVLGPLAISEADGTSAMVLFQWTGREFEARTLKRLPYGHAMEDRILCRDLTGDAMPELIFADSGGAALRIFQFTTSTD